MSQILAVDHAINFLEPFVQSGNLNFLIGSGASAPAIRIAGTIESEINARLTANDEAGANTLSATFVEAINDAHAKIVASSADVALNKVIDSYSRFVSHIDAILFARKNLLLSRQATVFTTNYDMLLERASGALPGIVLNDGFDRAPNLDGVFAFAPERYFDRTFRTSPIYRHNSEIPTINLVKLHGSLSWRRNGDTVIYNPAVISKLNAAEKADPNKVREYLASHFLILPNFRKFHATLMDRIYYDLLRLFSKAMDQENALLVVFGFSFTDEHILDITRRSLRNPTSHLVIFSYDKASSTSYEAKFSKHRNVTIFAPPTGAFIDFEKLNEILSHVVPEDEES